MLLKSLKLICYELFERPSRDVTCTTSSPSFLSSRYYLFLSPYYFLSSSHPPLPRPPLLFPLTLLHPSSCSPSPSFHPPPCFYQVNVSTCGIIPLYDTCLWERFLHRLRVQTKDPSLAQLLSLNVSFA